tara:strand:+ start:152 stop:718 length:567 start_codon:yes stop_codon:yes gene_type:complete
MRTLLTILLIFFSVITYSQCVSNQSFTLTPVGPYQPGDVVVVDYTLGTFTQLNINWIIAFQINLGIGWTNLTPLIVPGNPGGSTGFWMWDLQNTFPSGLNFGPGWRFVNASAFNPDWGTSSTGPFTMRFRVTVGSTCTADNLLISMNVIGDCLTGGWNNGACCSDPAYQIYNGNVQVVTPVTSNINHY